jgi:hypothetical protein
VGYAARSEIVRRCEIGWIERGKERISIQHNQWQVGKYLIQKHLKAPLPCF